MLTELIEFYGVYTWLYVAIFGSLIGSFLNVVIYRLPIRIMAKEEEEDVESGFDRFMNRSMCPSCQRVIPWYLNIPIFGWFYLKGRARCCGAKISFQYPAIELIGATIPVVMSYLHGFTLYSVLLSVALWALLALVVIDLKYFLLPDVLVIIVFFSGALASYLGLTGYGLTESLLSSLGSSAFFCLVSFLYSKFRDVYALGDGDSKLIGALAIWLGPMGTPLILIGTVFGIIPLVIWGNRFDREQADDIPDKAFPYGPALVAGFIFALFFGKRLIYL